MPIPLLTDAASGLVALRTELAQHHPEWRVENLEVLGGGLEFNVFRGHSALFGEVALRVARKRWIHNDNDPHLDARRLLAQEAMLLRHVRQHGLFAPTVHVFHTGDKVDFLMTELLVAGCARATPGQMGALAATLHRLPPPDVDLEADPRRSLAETLAERIARRARVVERLAGVALALPRESELLAALRWTGGRSSLLHMDLRPANLIVRGDEVAAMDWSNALIGDPAVELARIAEFGYLDAEFLAAYGDDPLARSPSMTATLFRLDAALMLAVVHLSEAPDPGRAELQVARVRTLVDRLGHEV
jgi:Phosphotransferase enzyme family